MPQAYPANHLYVNQGTATRRVEKRHRRVRNRSKVAAHSPQHRKTHAKRHRRPSAKAVVAISAVSLLVLSVSHLVAPHEVLEVEPESSNSVSQIQVPDLQSQVSEWFANPDSIGAIALGVAEGTRTMNGERTHFWNGHIDPGNGAINQGTFSWQLEAISPEAADQLAITYIQTEVIPHILEDAKRLGINLNTEALVQGIDLWNQAPSAGADFVENLNHCQQQGDRDDVLLCARVRSYYNPTTAQLEASGFDNQLALLKQDQWRRISTIRQVLHLQQPAPLVE